MEDSNKISSQLSDQDLYYDAVQLSDSCNELNRAVNDSNLSSISVTSIFSPLIQNGVGTGYFTSLDNALKKSDKLALSISRLIAIAASEQQSADTSSAKKSDNISYGTSNYRNNSNANYSVSTTNYSTSNSGTNLNVKTDAENKNVELTDDELIKMVDNLQSIIDGSLFELLKDTDNASKIKEKLLASPNISSDLKEKISSMDQNEIQTKIKDMYLSGKAVSNFSKIIITIYDNDLKNNFKNATIYDSAKSIRDVYSFLSKQDNSQEQLKELYLGTSKIDKVDDNVINFTRNFIDTLATAANVSYEEVLTNANYKETILAEITDLSKTYSLIDSVSELEESYKEKLYSNIIIKTVKS